MEALPKSLYLMFAIICIAQPNGKQIWGTSTTEVVGSSLYQTSDLTWEEFVSTLPKIVGFLRVLRFSPSSPVFSEFSGFLRVFRFSPSSPLFSEFSGFLRVIRFSPTGKVDRVG